MFMVMIIPLGFVCGLVTERVASRRVIPKLIRSRIWNTLIHSVAAILVWHYIISKLFIPPNPCFAVVGLENTYEGLHLALGTILNTLHIKAVSRSTIQQTSYNESCSNSELASFLILFILKCILFCASAQLGTTLQPVGITGGIACGKTTVSKILQEMIKQRRNASIVFIDVDLIAHDILIPRPNSLDTAYWKIVKAFSEYDIFEEKQGSNASLSPRSIDRSKLGDIIFKDASKRRLLNSITHPLISKIMMKKIIYTGIHLFQRNAPFALVDIPLLFEVGLKMKLLFGIKVVVATPRYLQLHRLSKRNPELSAQQCEDRIASQMPVIKKVEMADMVVWNNSSLSNLEKEVENALVCILNRKRGYLGLSMIHFILLGASMQSVYYLLKSIS